jgi:lysine-N-methylase
MVGPSYAGAFRCIGPVCEDTCCGGWDIPVDKATYERYQLFSADQLGWAVTGFVSVTSAQVPDSLYAHIHMAASGECPFFEADRLCGIQKKYGADLLSSSCSIYPRALNRVDGVLEGSLSLSCPEAARNVLLDPGFLDRVSDLEGGEFRTDNFFSVGNLAAPPERRSFAEFHAVRAAILGMVKDRSRPVWLRMLRVGALCQRLEVGEDAEAAIAGVLGEEVDRELTLLAGNRPLRLEIAMRLSDERVRDESAGKRFQEWYWAFIEGIASGGGDDLELLEQAERDYYRPFMEAHPDVLENFLVNYVYQRLFPFGRAGGVTLRERSIFEEFVLLATQFGWIETLLMGVSGRFREEFGGAHIVGTVQSFHRAVEHYPGVLEDILAMMRERGLQNLRGMALMLR